LKHEIEQEGFPTRRVLIIAGRAKEHFVKAYGQLILPVLPVNHELSRLYLMEAHEYDHGVVSNMAARTRAHVWIYRINRLAKKVRSDCFQCRCIQKRREGQKMAPLPAHRMGPAPVFESTAIDLFSPLSIQGAVNKRTTGKCWGVIFVCTAILLVLVEIERERERFIFP